MLLGCWAVAQSPTSITRAIDSPPQGSVERPSPGLVERPPQKETGARSLLCAPVARRTAKLPRSASLEIFSRPRPSGKVYLALVDDTGAVGDMNHVPRTPMVFTGALIGAGPDTRDLL